MRTLVTGGAGFIGSHVVHALVARGDEVHVVDDLSKGKRENVPATATLHVHDVREPLDAIVRAAGAEGIVHLAAQADVRVSVEQPSFDAAVNVLGTVNVLEAARRVGARVVFASTGGAIYGECDEPAREDDPCLPLSPYGAAKLAGEGYLGAFGRLYGTPHLALRFGNVYGPRQDPHGEAGVVAIFLGRLLEGRECRIFGDGTQSRDYVYVGDVARATLSALGGGLDGVVNVGTGTATTVLELYEACRTVAGSDADPVHEPARQGELGRSVLSPDYAERALGFRYGTSLHEGVAATWAWLQDQDRTPVPAA
jgi:UDP-glucose 4-epimerase